jgi:hypothetical protein
MSRPTIEAVIALWVGYLAIMVGVLFGVPAVQRTYNWSPTIVIPIVAVGIFLLCTALWIQVFCMRPSWMSQMVKDIVVSVTVILFPATAIITVDYFANWNLMLESSITDNAKHIRLCAWLLILAVVEAVIILRYVSALRRATRSLDQWNDDLNKILHENNLGRAKEKSAN